MNFSFTKDNCFCISLMNSDVRWLKMLERFTKINLDVTRFPAAMGGTSDVTDNFDPRLNNGEQGCSQSHINVWRHVLNQNIPYALILEDDACFDKNWKCKLDTFFNDINDNDWDIILLNASDPSYPLDKWVIAQEQCLTGGYIISFKGAKRILEMFSGYHHYFSSDWMTSRIQLHNHAYTYFPWLIIQEGKDSAIRNNFDAHYQKVVNCLGEINYDLDNYII